MDLLWITDPHLNFLPAKGAARSFGRYLTSERKFDAVVLTGDIGEGDNVAGHLKQFAEGVGCQVYFTLGNHDYYKSSFEEVREEILETAAGSLSWLDRSGIFLLGDKTALTGHDGWFDARIGKPKKSHVVLNDFELISDLSAFYNRFEWQERGGRGRLAFLDKVRALGVEAAESAKPKLLEALKLRETVIFATHFPPFKEACWHEGAISDSRWLPWFTCEAMGQMLLAAAAKHPENRILVLCGHTHSYGECQPAPNLRVLTGKAVYGAPDISGVISTPLATLDFTSETAGDRWSGFFQRQP